MVIHRTALIASDTVLDGTVSVGPWCVVGIDGDAPPVGLGPGSVIRSHSVLYRGVQVGAGFHAGHGVLIREQTIVGEGVSIGSHTVVEHHVVIGDRARLHSGCFIPELSMIEPDVWIGPHVVVTNAKFPNEPDTKEHLRGVRICSGARIGAAVVLLPGVTIGAGSLIGAGAVVVDDVAEGATIVGNPGRSL